MAKPNYFLAWLGHEAPAGRLPEQSGSILNVSKRAYATISERVNSVTDVIDGRKATGQSARALDCGGSPPSGVDGSHDRRVEIPDVFGQRPYGDDQRRGAKLFDRWRRAAFGRYLTRMGYRLGLPEAWP
jgi:hypothetical protein